MSGINIKETERFNDIVSYLDESKTQLTSLSTDLNNIGNGLYGSVKTVYNNSSSSVKSNISELMTKIEGAKSHINSSLGVYYSVDKDLRNKLNDVYDSIFNDEDYEDKLVYVASGESKKLSYEEFKELVNSSEEYFKNQREKVYNEFLANMVTTGPTMIKKLGSNIFNAVVENTYFCISDYKPGSDRYKRDLANFKLKFGKTILNQYDNLDFIPKCYMKTGEYNRALLALSFDDKDYHEKYDMILKTFNAIDERTKSKGYEIGQTMSNIYSFSEAKNILTSFPDNATPKELLDYYSKALNSLKEDFDIAKHRDRGIVIPDYAYEPDKNAWYDRIKNTKAFKKIKDYLPTDKNEIFNMTNNMEFLSAIYQYDGMDALQTIYSNYYSDCIGEDAPKEYLAQSNLDEVVRYSTMNTILGAFSEPLMDTKEKLRSIDNSESTSLLLLAKELDTSDITDEMYKNKMNDYNSKWTGYCDGNDYTKYLEDWQLKAFVKVLEHDKDLASKLFNNSEGANRGILNEKIMEGYAFDVAKDRVKQMAMDNNNGINADEYLRSILFSAAYGFGYGITDFTTGIADVFTSDGKMDKREMEKNNIMAILAGDYSLQSSYYNKDPKTMEMFSTDYPDDFVNKIKLKNFTKDEIDDFINDCKNNKVPRYELEYYLGNISYEEFIKYQNVANLSDEDLSFYANLNNNSIPKWLADKSFKVSNTVGTMAIPTVLSLIASAASPAGATVGTAMKLLSTTASGLSYGSLFASSLGRNVEGLKQSGETNNAYIWTNALLTSAFESFGEMALGRILKPTKLTGWIKETTAANHPFLGAIFNASDNFESYLIRNNCNERLAKFLSNIVGEVIQENTENIFGHGVDAATSAIFKQQLKLPTLDELISEAWETTWVTALSTPILNGFTNFSLSNVPVKINVNGVEMEVSLSDMIEATNEDTNRVDYTLLTNNVIKNNITEVHDIDTFRERVEAAARKEDLLNHLKTVPETERNTVIRNWKLPNGEQCDITLGMIIDSIDPVTGTLTAPKLSHVVYLENGKKPLGALFLDAFGSIINKLDTNIFGNLRIGAYQDFSSGEYVYATLNELKPFIDETKDGGLNTKKLEDYLIKNGKLEGFVIDEQYFYQTIDQKQLICDREKLFEILSRGSLTYGDLDLNSISIMDTLAGRYDYISKLNPNEFYLLDHLDEKRLNKLRDFENATPEVQEMLLWTRDTLPQLFRNYLGDLAKDDILEKMKYSVKLYNLEEDFINECLRRGYTQAEAEMCGGFNSGGQIHTYLSPDLKHVLIHEGNHSLGSVRAVDEYIGVNEAITEIMTHYNENYNETDHKRYIAYKEATVGFNELMNKIPTLSEENIQESYYKKHNVDNIKKAIDDIMGDGYFNGTFAPAFDAVLLENDVKGGNDKTIIDKVVSDVISTYRLKLFGGTNP